ncbi:MAG: hypothetical protein JSV00_00650 [bacterium]|nr:MAG: hypothetical protein JSV00_00650 [bacterium]
MIRSCYVSHHCPQCSGEVVFDQGATGTRCRYCGAGLLVLGSRSMWLNFLIKPVVGVRDTAHEVTRIAMKNGWKPPLLRSVIPFYFPFYRTTGHAIKWIKGVKPGLEIHGDASEEILTRHVDLMRPAHMDLSPGLFSPGYRAQSLNLALATRENAGKAPFAPIQKDREEHSRDMEEAFFDSMPEPGLKVWEERCFRLWETNSVLFFPLLLVEIREGRQMRLLLLDAVGGSLIRQIGHEEMETLLDNLELRESRSPGETRLKLAPLMCPECAGDLDPDPSAHLRFCKACGRGWEEGAGRLRERECLWAGTRPQARDTSMIFLPFWRRHADDRELYIPAFSVRSPRLLYNLAARYYHAQFPAEPIPYENRLRIQSLPVGLPPDGADEMADVVAKTNAREQFQKKGTSQSLVLVPFRKKGPDLVEPFKGLAVPISSLEADLP